MADTTIRIRASGRVIPVKAVDNGDGTYSLDVAAPENEEVVARASSSLDGPWTSGEIENKYYQGVAVYITTSNVVGSPTINSLYLFHADDDIALQSPLATIAASTVTAAGRFKYLFAPVLLGTWDGTAQAILPRRYKLSISTDNDPSSNHYDMGIVVEHLL